MVRGLGTGASMAKPSGSGAIWGGGGVGGAFAPLNLLRMGFTRHFKCRSARTMLCPHPSDGVLVSCAVSANEFRDVLMGDIAAEKG